MISPIFLVISREKCSPLSHFVHAWFGHFTNHACTLLGHYRTREYIRETSRKKNIRSNGLKPSLITSNNEKKYLVRAFVFTRFMMYNILSILCVELSVNCRPKIHLTIIASSFQIFANSSQREYACIKRKMGTLLCTLTMSIEHVLCAISKLST